MFNVGEKDGVGESISWAITIHKIGIIDSVLDNME